MKLNVGRFQFRLRLGENTNLAGAHSHRPGAPQDILHADQHAAKDVVDLIVEGRDIDPVDHADLEVVLQIPADTGQVFFNRDAEAAKNFSWTNARNLENLWRSDGAA